MVVNDTDLVELFSLEVLFIIVAALLYDLLLKRKEVYSPVQCLTGTPAVPPAVPQPLPSRNVRVHKSECFPGKLVIL